MVGPLPVTTQGNKYIIIATDYLTKWPEAWPTADATAVTATDFLVDCIIARHGAPRELLSNQGRTFLNQLLAAVCNR